MRRKLWPALLTMAASLAMPGAAQAACPTGPRKITVRTRVTIARR